MGHGGLFSKIAFKPLPWESNAPIPANIRPGSDIVQPIATIKSLYWGCSRLKFQASLTFHKKSAYAPFEKRPPCPSFYKYEGEGMKLFERTHLPDQNSSAMRRGPNRALHGNGPMESTSFLSSRSQGGPLVAQEQMRTGEECHAEP
jgi:hypothetical protein